MDTAVTEARPSVPSFEEVFASEYRGLVQAVYLLSGSLPEAEDIAQESLARAYERWERVGRMESPVGYVYRTALNLYHRKERRRRLLRAKLVPQEPEADALSLAETRTDVRRILRELPLNLRVVLVLGEFLNLSSNEIGAVLGIKPVTARSRLHRARTAFRRRIGENYV